MRIEEGIGRFGGGVGWVGKVGDIRGFGDVEAKMGGVAG